jgi:hypothetical protein
MHRSLGVFQEWSELKNNQRLDFFVLLYQDKRTNKIFSFMVFFFVKKKRKANRKIIQIALIVCVMNLIRLLIGGTKAFTQ